MTFFIEYISGLCGYYVQEKLNSVIFLHLLVNKQTYAA